MTAKPNFAPSASGEHGADDAAAPATGPFVLNLCSSTTPMALAQSELPELKRFTFFVSRRFEEGRERFRLHMGYFATLAEAEEWLNVVREIYPGAWAGEAPGRKLRERAAAAAAAQAQHAVGPQQQRAPSPPPPAPAAAPEPHPFAIPENPHPFAALTTPSRDSEPIPELIPILQAAPSEPPPAPKVPPAPPAPVAVRKPEPVVAPPPRAVAAPAPVAPPPVAAKPSIPVAAKPSTPVAAKPSTPVAAKPSTPVAAKPSTPVAAKPSPVVAVTPPAPPTSAPKGGPAAAAPPVAAAATPAPSAVDKPAPGAQKSAPAFADSNVREVLQALGDASATGETRLMRSPPPPRDTPAPAAKEALSDTQVLKLLEVRRDSDAEPQPAAVAASQGSIPMLKPDDTGTREALKAAVVSNAPVLFAVQLQWSVQAVELDKVPPLAIFSAYTLYTVEGSRDGRKWYGLRLGFFSDAISAKQVAHYVRSEFAAVAVVPVSAQERARATDQDKQAAILGSAPATPAGRVDEFKLIDDATDAAAAVAKMAQRPASAAPVAEAPAKKIPGRPVPKPAARAPAPAAKAARPAAKGRGRAPGKVGASESRGEQSLEETLEILGAGQLAIDNGNGETLNASGVRHLRVEVQKNSPFAKLLDRLSERMKKQ
jgi:hypothetical protein